MDAAFKLVETQSDVEEFFRWLGQRRTWLAVDTETSGLDWWRDSLRLIQIGDANTGWAFPFQWYAGAAKEAIESYSGPIAMHNSKFDLHFLEHNGIRFPRRNLHDTMVMAALVDNGQWMGLKHAGARHVTPLAKSGDQALKDVFRKNKWFWDTVPIDCPQYWTYACLDVILTSRLAEHYWPTIHNRFLDVYNVEIQSTIVLKDMEARGMRVDLDFARYHSGRISEYEKAMEQWFEDAYGITNPNSNATIARRIMADGVRLVERTPSGQYKMDEEVLASLDHPLANALLDYRQQQRIRSTYFDDFVEFSDNGVLHTTIKPLGARTGRMSAERPNLQNVPRNWVRSAFVARPEHKLLLIDFDQIELRLLAHYAGEKPLIDATIAGDDLHSFVGRMVYNQPQISRDQRQIVKHANFAKIYGAGVAKFALMAGITVEEASAFNQRYDAAFPAIARFIGKLTNKARTEGTVITPYLGRPQTVDGPDFGYKMVNYFIQGTAADVLKRKLIEVANTDAEPYMLLPIHDEIAFDVPADIVEDLSREVQSVMEETHSFDLPLTVGAEIVDRWGDKYAT